MTAEESSGSHTESTAEPPPGTPPDPYLSTPSDPYLNTRHLSLVEPSLADMYDATSRPSERRTRRASADAGDRDRDLGDDRVSGATEVFGDGVVNATADIRCRMIGADADVRCDREPA